MFLGFDDPFQSTPEFRKVVLKVGSRAALKQTTEQLEETDLERRRALFVIEEGDALGHDEIDLRLGKQIQGHHGQGREDGDGGGAGDERGLGILQDLKQLGGEGGDGALQAVLQIRGRAADHFQEDVEDLEAHVLVALIEALDHSGHDALVHLGQHRGGRGCHDGDQQGGSGLAHLPAHVVGVCLVGQLLVDGVCASPAVVVSPAVVISEGSGDLLGVGIGNNAVGIVGDELEGEGDQRGVEEREDLAGDLGDERGEGLEAVVFELKVFFEAGVVDGGEDEGDQLLEVRAQAVADGAADAPQRLDEHADAERVGGLLCAAQDVAHGGIEELVGDVAAEVAETGDGELDQGVLAAGDAGDL